jgi:predicted outer membrane protein
MGPIRALVLTLVFAVFGGALYTSWRNDGEVIGWTANQYGPLSPADRDFLGKVRQAGLWEMPVGQEMQARASQPRVREIAGLIHQEHQQLDARTIEVATTLGVELPNQASNDQRLWMQEITNESGPSYDATAVQRLREAHGIVLPIIAQVRVGTRNSVVRAFAEEADQYVTRHISYLESTGLVDYGSLPEPTTTSAPTNRPSILGSALFVVALCTAGLFILILLLVRRSRQRADPRHARRKVSDAAEDSDRPVGYDRTGSDVGRASV